MSLRVFILILFLNIKNMCTKVTSEMHISHGKTICYKIVKLPWDATFKDRLLHKIGLKRSYETMFQNSNVKIGNEYSGIPSLTKQYIEISTKIGNETGVGFIHSLQFKDDAIKIAKLIVGCTNVAVIECVIPDETPYFEGTWGIEEFPSYVSTNIKYVKRVY